MGHKGTRRCKHAPRVRCRRPPCSPPSPRSLIQAAGGIVTDWQGGPAHNGGRALAAANADIHAQALAILAKHA